MAYVGKNKGQGRVRHKETDRRFVDDLPDTIDNEYDPDEDTSLFEFLRDNPAFIDRPATIEEFLGPKYLNNREGVRPGVISALIEIFGEEVDPVSISKARRAMATGGIGWGKTTLASIAILYMVHYVECLRDPQKYYNMLEGSRIVFMLMSTSTPQAREVLFQDIRALLTNSPWFEQNARYDPLYKNELRFPKHIWILPGNSKDTTFEGRNILGGVIEEGDSHLVTANKDCAETGWNVIHNRISSRFSDPFTNKHRGLLLVIGQMKSATGFMARKMKELQNDPDAVVVRRTLWESYGWETYKKNGKYDVFWYDIDRKVVVSKEYAKDVRSDNIIPIPNAFFQDFQQNPVKALMDLAGIPPESTDPFFVLMDRVDAAMKRWHENHPDIDQPVSDSCTTPIFHPRLVCTDRLKRVLHIDVAYSSAIKADALGMAMGHVAYLVDMDGDIKPYIVFDFLLRVKAQTGSQILLHDIRQIVYHLKEDLGYRITQVTLDGTESLESIQIFNKRHIPAAKLSVDRNKMPYEDLRECVYEHRCEFPAYVTELRPGGGSEKVVIAVQELGQLKDLGKKIDHPEGGSKDVADAMAAVAHVLTGSGAYRRGLQRPGKQLFTPAGVDDTVDQFGTVYDPEFHAHFAPIDAEFVDEGDSELRDILGLGKGRPKVPDGMPQLEENPFGYFGRPRMF